MKKIKINTYSLQLAKCSGRKEIVDCAKGLSESIWIISICGQAARTFEKSRGSLVSIRWSKFSSSNSSSSSKFWTLLSLMASSLMWGPNFSTNGYKWEAATCFKQTIFTGQLIEEASWGKGRETFSLQMQSFRTDKFGGQITSKLNLKNYFVF